tara:strand:+ start:120 stop:1184 length:1065 start_codon:yes stop_codon:yes gene_type:complete
LEYTKIGPLMICNKKLKAFSFYFLFLFVLFLSKLIQAESNKDYFRIEEKKMSDTWEHLPEPPKSFKNSSVTSLEFKINLNDTFFNYQRNNLELNLIRDIEPKNLSLIAKKENFGIGFMLSNSNAFYLFTSRQIADEQSFNCYEFNSITLGSCANADFQVSSQNIKYDKLGANIISIEGNTKTFGIGVKKYIDSFWLDSVNIELNKTSYDYDWLSPIEDISSPFLLNMNFNGILLGDAIDSVLKRLPQRDSWSSNQLNFAIKQKFMFFNNFSLISEYDFVILDFKNYVEYQDTPEYNFKYRLGIQFFKDNLSMLVFGDYYHNNLIGFEPITFNKRTEHYFDQPYGELGINIVIKF